MKIGVFGGTFDPVHNGHMMIAEEAYKSLGLTEVLMVPAWQPMSKQDAIVTPGEQRLEMLLLAIQGRPYLKISTVEFDRGGPSYTVDTIEELRSIYGEGYEFYFILGWDSLAQLPTWHDPKRLIRRCILAAVPRPGYAKPDIKEMEQVIPYVSERVVFLDRPITDINATTLRGMAGMGENIDHMVPEKVAEYIKTNKLYAAPKDERF
jgi:nicotinate-nucleotide adenylyltransferase